MPLDFWSGNRNTPFPGLDNVQLQELLPGLARQIRFTNTTPDAALRYAVAESEDTVENGGPLGLTSKDLLTVYKLLLKLPGGRGRYQSSEDVSSQLMWRLEYTLTEDEQLMRCAKEDGYYKTAIFFLALAVISKQTQSFALGETLADFFFQHSHTMLETPKSDVAAQLARGIHQVAMDEEDKLQCFAAILRQMPRLSEVLFQNGNHIYVPVVRALRDAQDGIGLYGFSGRRRRSYDWSDDSFPSRFRSRRGRSPFERQLAIGYDEPTGRSRSAPGNRMIERQATRLLAAAEDMQEEVEKLRRVLG